MCPPTLKTKNDADDNVKKIEKGGDQGVKKVDLYNYIIHLSS